ncbi:alpha-L-rhamnosidase-related protein [Paenibacillus eucommiae]|uniref:Alpha-rhamnosidase n=1 Tax=Paenibacillus eucommiae TaxID=1355755 RepID=A0ABS4J551_9BACL|nr:alpha-rhamnosidase [Paenibacillus eucommiae]MBP1993914.1 hypothetical protein [Paenibacillus eucommiae]
MQEISKAAWIWYPGDFELWLHKEVSIRRDERGSVIPPFWRLDSHTANVKFRKDYDLEQEEEVSLYVEGVYNIALDSRYIYGNPETFTLPAGKHHLIISVFAETVVPAIFLQGKTLSTDNTWTVSTNNHKSPQAASWIFDTPTYKPSTYRLATEEIRPLTVEKLSHTATLLDFGKETFGYVQFHELQGSGKVSLYYGESREEALATEQCETLDEVHLAEKSASQNSDSDSDSNSDSVSNSNANLFTVPNSRAFRYVQIVAEETLQIGDMTALYEYLPVNYRGRFRCSDERINTIWDTSLYTMHLTTREFFLDGIKRDRWVWSGDAYQSFLMNYYTFFDNDVCRRTLTVLRGKDPVETHINHILDYSFYWILGLYDYYLYTGDLAFVQKNADKVHTLLDFCIGRTNEEGFMEGYKDDWVFVDWSEIDNRGEVCFEQILFCRSLEIGSYFAGLFQNPELAQNYEERARQLKERIFSVFWNDEAGGLVHSRYEGKLNNHVTKYANMFAMSFGYLDEQRYESVKHKVMLNDAVQPITTPYMRFYELASLCEVGDISWVLEEIRSYWGGMLDLGATSFWETFDPTQSGVQHYDMYGRPFAKSLCHAWGASPLYLAGKHVLGIRPLTPGYETYLIEPQLGDLNWFEGAVPLPDGDIELHVSKEHIKVTAGSGTGLLRFQSATEPTADHGNIEAKGNHLYELTVLPNIVYNVRYESN